MKKLRKRHGHAKGRLEYSAPKGFKREKGRLYFVRDQGAFSVERKNA